MQCRHNCVTGKIQTSFGFVIGSLFLVLNKITIMSSFNYLICLDLEATCWPGKYTNKDNAEIIEIGAVLLNVADGTIKSRFQSYVRPTICPKLSYFCIDLTGITQSQIDQHEPFSAVYAKFVSWIEGIPSGKGLRFASPTERNATENGPNATFCSWSDWDLSHYFKMECNRAKINIPSFLKTWVDARPMFDQKYFRGKTKFADALKHANIEAVGDAHSALSNATNLANLVAHLIGRGVQCNRSTGSY